MQQGLQENIINLLEIRFGFLAPDLVDAIANVQEVLQLKQLFKGAIAIEFPI
ncbi:MAG: hypothetical protein AB4290_12175 [Spirulina sp.]